MKKILAAVLTLASVSAFAQKSMVTLSGYETGDNQDRSVDFSSSTGNRDNGNVSRTNLALNYAYAITDSFQVGALYKNFNQKTSGDVKDVGDKSTTFGLQVIYNFAHQLTDTSYAALHYDMMKSDAAQGQDNEEKMNTWTVEFGHRWSLGTIAGMNFNYSPSANLAFAKTTSDANGTDDVSTTNFTLNFVKFDVLF